MGTKGAHCYQGAAPCSWGAGDGLPWGRLLVTTSFQNDENQQSLSQVITICSSLCACAFGLGISDITQPSPTLILKEKFHT